MKWSHVVVVSRIWMLREVSRKSTSQHDNSYLWIKGLQRWIQSWEPYKCLSLQWRHNGRDGVSNHQPHECLLNRLFRRRSKETSKLRVTGFCAGNSLGTGEFPAQMASNAENVSIWWRHHDEETSRISHNTDPPVNEYISSAQERIGNGMLTSFYISYFPMYFLINHHLFIAERAIRCGNYTVISVPVW